MNGTTQAGSRAARRWPQVLTSLLMLCGLVLCVVALSRGLGQVHVPALRAAEIMLLLLLAVLVIVASALGWLWYLRAMSGCALDLPDSLKQVAVLLLGKYVPGMVAGLAARVSSNAGKAGALDVLRASLAEQVGAIMAAALVSTVAVVAAFSWWLAAVAAALLPMLAVPLPALLDGMSRRIRRRGSTVATPDPRTLRLAWLAQLVQWLVTLLFVMSVVALVVPGASLLVRLELAGWYGMAVVIGIFVVVIPGGLGVRELCFLWPASQHLGEQSAIGLALLLRLAMSGVDLVAVLLWAGANVRTRTW